MMHRTGLIRFLLISGMAHLALLSAGAPWNPPTAAVPAEAGGLLNAALVPLRPRQAPATQAEQRDAATGARPVPTPAAESAGATAPQTAVRRTAVERPTRERSRRSAAPRASAAAAAAKRVTGHPVQQAPTSAPEPPAAPVTEAPLPPSDLHAEQLSQWRSQLRSQLIERMQRQFRYPLLAQRRGWQGVVRLRFIVTGEGRVSAVELADSSGHPLLDDSALASARRIRELPPALAPALSAAPVRVEIPVRFVLRG